MKKTIHSKFRVLLLSPFLPTFLLLGCKSESTRQNETETVKESVAVPFTKSLYLELLAKDEKNEPYPQKVYTFSGEVVGVKAVQTRSSTKLNLDMLILTDPNVEAACEFDSRSLDFISNQRVGERLQLRAKLESVSAGSVRFLGATQEMPSLQTSP